MSGPEGGDFYEIKIGEAVIEAPPRDLARQKRKIGKQQPLGGNEFPKVIIYLRRVCFT